MSLMSTGRASLKAAVGAEFMVPGTWTGGSAPCDAAGLAADGCGCREAGASQPGERDLRLTELHFREVHVMQVRIGGHGARQRRSVSPRAQQVRPRETGVRRHQSADRPGPVRLTRRGRAVAAGLTILAATAVAVVLWLSLAAGAQASSHAQSARAGYRGMTQVVVRPGQTLWSIASAAEPSADPRIVIQQIMDANALGGTSIHAGELLWVPKG